MRSFTGNEKDAYIRDLVEKTQHGEYGNETEMQRPSYSGASKENLSHKVTTIDFKSSVLNTSSVSIQQYL